MRHRVAALASAVLAGAMVNAAWATPAGADQPGFSVTVDAPDEFTAAGAAKTVTAVVTSENRQCRKVRWALLVHTGGGPGQVKVTRVEQERAFRVITTTEGNTTRIVDEALDPGLLCRGRTVTGTWLIEFDGPDGGAVQFEAQAFDVRDRLLSAGGAATEVDGEGGATAEPATPEDKEPEDKEPEDKEPEDAEQAAPADPGRGDPPATQETGTALVSEESTLLGPGLIVGGIFVFLGVLLLLRIRSRAAQARRREQALPTGFYTMPGAPR
jgi:hypothetical protein